MSRLAKSNPDGQETCPDVQKICADVQKICPDMQNHVQTCKKHAQASKIAKSCPDVLKTCLFSSLCALSDYRTLAIMLANTTLFTAARNNPVVLMLNLKTCLDLQNHVQTCKIMSRRAKLCPDVQKTCPDLQNHVQTCAKQVQTCQTSCKSIPRFSLATRNSLIVNIEISLMSSAEFSSRLLKISSTNQTHLPIHLGRLKPPQLYWKIIILPTRKEKKKRGTWWAFPMLIQKRTV